MAEGSSINRVYETNNYSILSKYSALKHLGLQHDKYLADIIENHLKLGSAARTAIINVGYAARMHLMNEVVSEKISGTRSKIFVLLGAGYDTLPLQCSGDANRETIWLEIDLPEVIGIKVKVLSDIYKQNSIQIYPGVYCFQGIHGHSLIACDMRNCQELRDKLKCFLDSKSKLVSLDGCGYQIINEVCLCYLEPDEVGKVLATIVESFGEKYASRDSGYIGFGPTKFGEHSQFDKIMTDHFKSVGYPLKYFPRPSEIKTLFEDQMPFASVQIEPMIQLKQIGPFSSRNIIDHMHRNGTILPFDEFESLDLYQAHYALVKAEIAVGRLSNYRRAGRSRSCSPKHHKRSECKKGLTLQPSPILRFGHASCLLNEDDHCSVVITGGFGIAQPRDFSRPSRGAHHRLPDCILIDDTGRHIQTLDTSQIRPNVDLSRVHGQICRLWGTRMLFLNGGRQSPTSKGCASSLPYLLQIVDDRIEVHSLLVQSSVSPSIMDTLAWRHRMVQMTDHTVLQVGGFSGSSTNLPAQSTVWNLNSNGLICRRLNDSATEGCLKRHSFGLDRRDCNTFLVFGGYPIDSGESKPSAHLYDMRVGSSQCLDSRLFAGCYGADVHFIDDYKFIRVGGILTSSGLPADPLSLYDLRHYNSQSLVTESDFISLEWPMLLTNATSCHLKGSKRILVSGGGGNYFTFGTHFNKHQLIYDYV